MNRIVLIGNGFDLAHGLKTSYADFINWYWEYRVRSFAGESTDTSKDDLCTFKNLNDNSWSEFAFGLPQFFNKPTGKEVIQRILEEHDLFEVTYSSFFDSILKCMETKGWVDIECEYYELLKKYFQEGDAIDKIGELNKQLRYLQNRLVEYLKSIEISDQLTKTSIQQKIFAPFDPGDISVEGQHALKEHISSGLGLDDRGWDVKLYHYGLDVYSRGYVDDYKQKNRNGEILADEKLPMEFYLPNQIMLLTFNYTSTAQKYCKKAPIFSVNQIHGRLETPESVIFGYGDELDEDYKKISNRNDNSLLTNVKSIRYLESDNYRKMLSFIESEPFQVVIMGHSCGNSDRTLLNTLFEHKNCISIKPYFYKKDDGTDNYLELIQNISRNFTDMKLMRDRVVNKTYCEPLT